MASMIDVHENGIKFSAKSPKNSMKTTLKAVPIRRDIISPLFWTTFLYMLVDMMLKTSGTD